MFDLLRSVPAKLAFLFIVALILIGQITTLRVGKLNNIRYCNDPTYAGANASAKIINCMADLPSTGGVADATGFEGVQLWTSDIWSGVTKPVTLKLGAASYTVSATQTPNCDGCSIIGLGRWTTTLKASGISKVLSIKKGTLFYGFKVDGTSATSAGKGIVAGDGTSWGGTIEGVSVFNFAGSGGFGLQIGDVVGATFFRNHFESNDSNVLVQGVTGGQYPTTYNFIGNRLETATQYGMKMTTCLNAHHIGNIFESSGKEGLLVTTGTVVGDVLECDFHGSHFEDNNGNNAANYQMTVLSNGGRTIRFEIQGGEFTPTGATKNINVNATGGAVAGMVINHVVMPDAAGINIVNAGTIYGDFVNFPYELNFATVVTDAGSNFRNFTVDTLNMKSAWMAWVPTYSCSSGNAATCFTGPGTVTTNLARYKLIGKTLHIYVAFSATLNAAITPSYLKFTLPSGVVANTWFTPAWIKDNGILVSGGIRADGGGAIQVEKIDESNFTIGSAVALVGVSATLEIN